MSDLSSAPLLITGLPRSGTSLVAGLLGEMGLWLGTTVPGGAANPRGFFEHEALREQVDKAILAQLGCDPLGVRKLPPRAKTAEAEGLREAVDELIRADGYDSSVPWGFKDAKLTLIWPVWRDALPDARWLIVSRPRELVVRSCLKTDFMRAHSDDPAFWERFCDEYELRLGDLRETVPSVMEVDATALIAGDFATLRGVAEAVGLSWDDDRARAFIDPAWWGDRHPGTATT